MKNKKEQQEMLIRISIPQKIFKECEDYERTLDIYRNTSQLIFNSLLNSLNEFYSYCCSKKSKNHINYSDKIRNFDFIRYVKDKDSGNNLAISNYNNFEKFLKVSVRMNSQVYSMIRELLCDSENTTFSKLCGYSIMLYSKKLCDTTNAIDLVKHLLSPIKFTGIKNRNFSKINSDIVSDICKRHKIDTLADATSGSCNLGIYAVNKNHFSNIILNDSDKVKTDFFKLCQKKPLDTVAQMFFAQKNGSLYKKPNNNNLYCLFGKYKFTLFMKKLLNLITLLHLPNVKIECKDFIKFIRKLNSKSNGNILLMLDPPYIYSEDRCSPNSHINSHKDCDITLHQNIYNTLNQCNIPWILWYRTTAPVSDKKAHSYRTKEICDFFQLHYQNMYYRLIPGKKADKTGKISNCEIVISNCKFENSKQITSSTDLLNETKEKLEEATKNLQSNLQNDK